MRNIAGLTVNLIVSMLVFGDVCITTSAKPTFVKIGDPIDYTIELSYPDTMQAGLMLSGERQLGQFDILSASVDSIETDNGIKTQKFNLKLALYHPNDAIIPPAAAVAVSKSGVADTLLTQPITIKFIALVPPKAIDSLLIKDVKQPIALPFPLEKLLKLFLIGFLIGAVVIAAIWVWGLKSRGLSILSFISPKRPPWEEALEMLDTLLNSDLLENNEFKEYFDRLTDILRWYIEKRFHIAALELSTTELMDNLKQTKPDIESLEWEWFTSKTKELLTRADLVKFAKFLPEYKYARLDAAAVKDLIEKTIPKPKAEEEIREGIEEKSQSSVEPIDKLQRN